MLNLVDLIIAFLPSYIANAIPVVLGGGRTIDDFLNKKIFGKHKTLQGVIASLLGAMLTALIIGFFYNINATQAIIFGFLVGLGVSFGDLFGSLLKRKMHIKEGDPFIGDPFLFSIFAVTFGWYYFTKVFGLDLFNISIGILLSALLHVLFNKIAFFIGVKEVPW